MTTLAELATQYNELATTLGETTVRRFPNRAAAERRLAALRTRAPTAGLLPLKEYRVQYNALVPKAKRLGVKAHIHLSEFESRIAGAAQLEKLRAAIAEASR